MCFREPRDLLGIPLDVSFSPALVPPESTLDAHLLRPLPAIEDTLEIPSSGCLACPSFVSELTHC